MSSDPILIPKGKEPINLLTGVFLKSVYFLDNELTKCIVIGIFKDRDNELGVLFKGRKNNVYWSYDAFCQLCNRFSEITSALSGTFQHFIKLETGEDIKVNNVFGVQYVYVSSTERNSVTLNSDEWNQFIRNLPIISKTLLGLFYIEHLIKIFIDQVLSETENYSVELPYPVGEQLISELQLWRQ